MNKDAELQNSVSVKSEELKEDLANQLGKNPEIAPAFLGLIQSFLNDTFRSIDHDSKAEISIHLTNDETRHYPAGTAVIIHESLQPLQWFIKTLAKAHDVNLDIYSPENEDNTWTPLNFLKNRGLGSFKEENSENKLEIIEQLFISGENKTLVDQAIRHFNLQDEKGRCIADKGTIRGFVLAAVERGLFNQNLKKGKRMLLFQQYINDPEPTRNHTDSKRSDEIMRKALKYFSEHMKS